MLMLNGFRMNIAEALLGTLAKRGIPTAVFQLGEALFKYWHSGGSYQPSIPSSSK